MSVSESPAINKSVWDRVRPVVLYVIIGSIVAAGLVAVLAVVVGEFGTVHLQAILTIVAIITFTLLAWYDAGISSKRSSTFALVGVAVSFYLLIAAMFKIWAGDALAAEYASEYGGEYYNYGTTIVGNFGEWVWLVIIARFALLHAHLLLIIHRRYATPVLRIVAVATLGFIALFGILLSLPTLFDKVDFGEIYWRLVAAVFILNFLGTVLIPLSNALFAPKKPVAVNARPTTVVNRPPVYEQPVPEQQHYAPPVAPVLNQHIPTPGAIVFETAPVISKALAWPRYVDGSPLPVGENGEPDFSQVLRY